MRQGNRELKVNIDKFIETKHLVEEKRIQRKDACAQLGISLYLFNKWSDRIDSEGRK